MKKVMNLGTNEELEFDDSVSDLWAVCYAYCEEKNLLSGLFHAEKCGRLVPFSLRLPITCGIRSIACGDWAMRLFYSDTVPERVEVRRQDAPEPSEIS